MQCHCYKNKKEAEIHGSRCPHKAKDETQFCGIHKKCRDVWHPKSPPKVQERSSTQLYAKPDINGIIFRSGLALLLHQKKCLKWMSDLEDEPQKYGINGGIIQLDMGLGKTLIALYWILLQRKHHHNPYLVVCDKSLITNWLNEADKFFGKHIKFFVFYNDYNKLEDIRRSDFDNVDFVITTYNTVRSIADEYIQDIKRPRGIILKANFSDQRATGRKLLIHTRWGGIFADEAQAFNNPSTKSFSSMMRLSASESWCLTGTPIRNSDKDMYSLMRFCGLDIIQSAKEWSYEYYTRKHLYRFIKSMDYKEANIKIPEIVERNYVVELDDNQLELYELYESVLWEALRLYAMRLKQEETRIRRLAKKRNLIVDLTGIQINFYLILAIFTRLRQICIIPQIALLNTEPVQFKRQPKIIDAIVYNLPEPMKKWIADPHSSSFHQSIKIKQATDIIQDILKNTNEKILVFSSFKQVLDMYHQYLEKKFGKGTVVQLDGSQTINERAKSIAKFKEGNARIFLITFKTGSQGLTLIEANHIIPMEPWWSPTVYDQAIARAHRIGQKKNVYVYNILARGTIETKIMKICSKKQTIIEQFLGREGEEISLKLDFKGLCKILTE